MTTYSRVRAVSADGNKTDVPVTLAARFVVRLDDRQPGVFASSARVGLKRARSEPSDLAEIVLELLQLR